MTVQTLIVLLVALGLLTACGAESTSPSGEVATDGDSGTSMAHETEGEEGDEEAPDGDSKDAVAQADAFIASKDISKTGNWKTSLPKPPKFDFEGETKYFWVLDTNLGSIKIKLLEKTAPMHVSSTIYLTRLGFYDGVKFHRVIPGFMAQGGDPLGTGTGGPGYKYAGEFQGSARHDRKGTLSMANAGPGTDGSQFFLTFTATPHLDGKHTVFGQVVEGLETLDELEKRGTSPRGTPTERLLIEKATIVTE